MNRFLTRFGATVLAALCTTACGGPKPRFTANVSGVPPIVLCMPAAEIPATSEGLYDAFAAGRPNDERQGGYTVLHFTLHGAPVMDATLYRDRIASIEVVTPTIASAEGARPGMRVAELFRLGGQPEMGNDGQLSISLGSLDFRVSGLKPAAETKLKEAYASGTVPQIDVGDFESDAQVERILIY